MLVLYHNDMSLCAQKVRLCLAEKGLEWDSRHLALRAGEHQQPWYRNLNRRAVVPTLVDRDKVVPESNVILEYLDEAYPNRPMLMGCEEGRSFARFMTALRPVAMDEMGGTHAWRTMGVFISVAGCKQLTVTASSASSAAKSNVNPTNASLLR